MVAGMNLYFDTTERSFCANVYFRNWYITQIMVISNSMVEYDDTEVEPITGAFYAYSSHLKDKPSPISGRNGSRTDTRGPMP